MLFMFSVEWRIEQFNRYCAILDNSSSATTNLTSEDTIDYTDPANLYNVKDPNHRNFDLIMENTVAGEIFKASCRGVPSARRRHDVAM